MFLFGRRFAQCEGNPALYVKVVSLSAHGRGAVYLKYLALRLRECIDSEVYNFCILSGSLLEKQTTIYIARVNSTSQKV